jgi:hypothetical protein
MFWQRDTLAILIRDRLMAERNLTMSIIIPFSPHWQLCKESVEYKFSSARFYEKAKMGLECLHIGWLSAVVGAAYATRLLEHQQRRSQWKF